MTPREYDFELEIEGFVSSLKPSVPSQPLASSSVEHNIVPPGGLSRKRAHEGSDESRPAPPPEFGRRRVEVWPVEDLLWIHEHRKRDLMQVHLVDEDLVAVKFLQSSIEPPMFQSIYSDRPEMEGMVTIFIV